MHKGAFLFIQVAIMRPKTKQKVQQLGLYEAQTMKKTF